MTVNDIMQAASRWNNRRGDANYDNRFDFDNDGDIDILDIMRVANVWNTACPGTTIAEQHLNAVAAQSGMKVRLVGRDVTGVGAQFTLTGRIQDVQELAAFQGTLVYDPAILELLDVGLASDFHAADGQAVALGPVHRAGQTDFGAFLFGGDTGLTGDTDLFTASFLVRGAGSTEIELMGLRLMSATGEPIIPGKIQNLVLNSRERTYLPMLNQGRSR